MMIIAMMVRLAVKIILALSKRTDILLIGIETWKYLPVVGRMRML